MQICRCERTPSTTTTPTAAPTDPLTFEEELLEYFLDIADCEDCADPTTAHVSSWPQNLPSGATSLPNLKAIANAMATDIEEYDYQDGARYMCDGGDCFSKVLPSLGGFYSSAATWDTSTVTTLDGAAWDGSISNAATSTQVSSAVCGSVFFFSLMASSIFGRLFLAVARIRTRRKPTVALYSGHAGTTASCLGRGCRCRCRRAHAGVRLSRCASLASGAIQLHSAHGCTCVPLHGCLQPEP